MHDRRRDGHRMMAAAAPRPGTMSAGGVGSINAAPRRTGMPTAAGGAPPGGIGAPLLGAAPAAAGEEPFRAVFFAARLRSRARGLHRQLSDRMLEVFPPMSQRQSATLSPWEKYRQFNRFPFKFVLQIMLLVLVTIQTWFYSSSVLPYFNQSTAAFAANFYGFSANGAKGAWHSADTALLGSRGRSDTVLISTIPDFQSSVQSVYTVYHRYLNSSIDGYSPRPAEPTVRGAVSCLPAEVGLASAAAAAAAELICASAGFELTVAAPAGPFLDEVPHATYRAFFDRVETVSLEWVLVDTSVDFLDHFGLSCFEVEWTLRADYWFESAGQMRVLYSSACSSAPAVAGGKHRPSDVDYRLLVPLCNLLQGAVAVLLAVLCLRSLLKAGCRRVDQEGIGSSTGVPGGTVVEDGQDFSIIARRNSRNWLVMLLIQSVVNIAAAVAQCDPLKTSFYASDPLLGISVGLAYFNLMRCFEYQPRYYLLVHTLTHGLPGVGRFILGCLPIFIAFTGAATIFFGRAAQSFGSLSGTVTTLFSLLNGDTMLDTFDAVDDPKHQLSSGVGRLFLASFIMLFSYAVLNVFIAIIEQAWQDVQRETQNWRLKLEESAASGVPPPPTPPPTPTLASGNTAAAFVSPVPAAVREQIEAIDAAIRQLQAARDSLLR
jgi:hypothetical protein